MHIQSKLIIIAHACHWHTLQLSAGMSVWDSRLEVTEEEEGVLDLTPTHWAFKKNPNPLVVGAGTDIRTKYLPAH